MYFRLGIRDPLFSKSLTEDIRKHLTEIPYYKLTAPPQNSIYRCCCQDPGKNSVVAANWNHVCTVREAQCRFLLKRAWSARCGEFTLLSHMHKSQRRKMSAVHNTQKCSIQAPRAQIRVVNVVRCEVCVTQPWWGVWYLWNPIRGQEDFS